ncbi:MAG: hypothetical protein P8Y66_08525 [Nitrospirota bacterium]|jgi:hypothetical protein
MATPKINNPIAERILDLEKKDGSRTKIRVRLAKPERSEDGDWVCPYEITGFERPTGLRVFGVDAMQALLLAIKGLSVDLEIIARREEGKLSWLGQAGGGFPSLDETGTFIRW